MVVRGCDIIHSTSHSWWNLGFVSSLPTVAAPDSAALRVPIPKWTLLECDRHLFLDAQTISA